LFPFILSWLLSFFFKSGCWWLLVVVVVGMGVAAAEVGDLAIVVVPQDVHKAVSGLRLYCKVQVTSYKLQVTSYK
jgi:hypothetical protein